MCVGGDSTLCLRENGIRVVLSLSFFSLTVYDVTKKALCGRNMFDCTEMSKKSVRSIVETTTTNVDYFNTGCF